MGKYKLIRFENLSEQSNKNSNNSGHTPQTAKYIKHYVDPETGEYVSNTDLRSRIYKRDRLLDSFCDFYEKYNSEERVSILAIIVDESNYDSISKFLNSIKKKLSRKEIDTLGYVWVRDCGEKRAIPHFHILLSTSWITSSLFNELFSKKRNTKYQLEFMQTKNGMKKYLKRKGLYGSKGKRSFGKSKLFKKPN